MSNAEPSRRSFTTELHRVAIRVAEARATVAYEVDEPDARRITDSRATWEQELRKRIDEALSTGLASVADGSYQIARHILEEIRDWARSVGVRIISVRVHDILIGSPDELSSAALQASPNLVLQKSAQPWCVLPIRKPGDIVASRYRIERCDSYHGSVTDFEEDIHFEARSKDSSKADLTEARLGFSHREELIGSTHYRAIDQKFGYTRALEEIQTPDEQLRRQLSLEADLLSNTVHPNLPRGYGLVEDHGCIYLVMEYVRGKHLDHILIDRLQKERRALDELQLVTWMIDICDALTELHTRTIPIVHRNITTSNILITPELRPVLVGFALAKQQSIDVPTTTVAKGISPGFAPPEQYMHSQHSGNTDARTDVYSMGAVMYACLSGKNPPEAPARLLAQAGISEGVPLERLRELNPDISNFTELTINRALELAPERRQQTARELRDDLQKALVKLSAPSLQRFAVPVEERSLSTIPMQDRQEPQFPVGAPRVFISHAHGDTVFTERLAADLRTAGVDIWVDITGIDQGDFLDEINEALGSRDWLIVILTPDALNSRWVRMEVNAAIGAVMRGQMKAVIPILATKFDEHQLPATWAMLHRYDATSDYPKALHGILHALGIDREYTV